MGDFRRLVITAVVAGVAAGFWLSAARQIWVVPLILEAEVHEHTTTPHTHAPGIPGDHAWQPTEGLERNAWTWAANLLTSLGFGLLLAAGYAWSGRKLSAVRGLLWGLAGWAVFSLAPAIRLPPALPGGPELPLAPRQLWWIATVVLTAAGLALLAFASGRWWRWVGLPVLALPLLIPAAPSGETPAGPLLALTQRFIAITLLLNLASWLVLGAVSGWLWSRPPRQPRPSDTQRL